MFKSQQVGGGAASPYTRLTRTTTDYHAGTDQAPFETSNLDDTLTFPVAANKSYLVRGFVLLDDPDSYQPWQADFAVPSGAVINGKGSWSGQNTPNMFWNTSSYDRLEAYGGMGAQTQYVCEFWFIIKVASTPGNVTMRHYNIGGSPTLGDIGIMKGSYIEYSEVG